MEELNMEVDTKKNTDAYAALIELDNKERSFKSNSNYFKAYTLSVLLPPIGIYYFFKYLFFGDGSQGSIKAGFISLGLTTASLILTIWLSWGMFNQVANLAPGQNTEILKEYGNPNNQEILKDLFQ